LYGLGSVEDVSEYHSSQEKLGALNASLRAIVETSPLAIYSVTPEGIVTLWNPAAEKMFGLTEAEVLGQISPFSSGTPAGSILELRRRVLAGETLHGVEIHWKPVEGEPIDVSVAAAPLDGQAGAVVGVLVTCSDITNIKATSRKLDEQLRFTQELLEVIPNPIFYKGRDGKYLGFNRAWEQFFGLARDEWVGKTYGEVFSHEPLELIAAEDAGILAGEPIAKEVRLVDGKGTERQMMKHISRFTSADGDAAGIIGVLTDITDLKEVANALEVTEGRFRALTESAMDIVTVLDRHAIIRYQSPSVTHLLGVDPADMIGRCQYDFVHHDDVDRLRSAFEALVDGEVMTRPVEFRVRAVSGGWRSLESIGKNCLEVPAVQGVIVNTRDVSERRVIQEHIQHLAFHDALTGLPNRSLMQDRISQAIARAERSVHKFAVMFIDIDNFKNINDTLGHDAGDELLCEVARRFGRAVRARDTIARQGGDEFIVLLDQLDGQQGATRVAQKILDALRAPFVINQSDQHVSGSIGVAVFPEDGADAATLLKNADTAMFHSKALGKNTYQFFTSQMNIAVKRRAVMESKLRAAVKDGAFALAYQPQIDLVSGEIVAVESLVRWNSEDSGTVMPGEFIPLAEETGLINQLGEWVLREACRQNKAWLDAGLKPCRVAVNISARQLNDKGFVKMLVGILNETGLPPELLELELTESQVMRQGEGSVMLLHEVADLGVNLAIDDFGTGYSSLSYLKRLPITKLKIDQSFIRDITVDPNDAAIVVAIINMAKSLDLDVIAEGIETAGQLTLLRTKGCGVGQGYYFSIPLGAAAIEALLKKQSMFDPSGHV
jgi:diguanylate cyclase (GGDEF)-like protein/PAS domain S-box-containing protein